MLNAFFVILWTVSLDPRHGIAFICAGYAAKTAICRRRVELLWWHHGFEGEVLKEGSEEEEEFCASQSLTKTCALACQKSTQKLV